MKVWRGIGALLSAGMLVLSAVGFATAAPPTYTISVSKTADPGNVPPTGGDVTFTVSVTATGTGFFQAVTVSGSLAGCSIAGPFGDEPTGPSAGNLDGGETWSYTCSVTDVVPGTTSTATVHGCHNMGTDCNQANHDATGQGQVTLGEGAEPTEVPPTEVPPTEVPPTEVPPTEVPPTEVPPTEVPPTEVPPTEVPPTEVPPTEVPPTEVPPTEVPPTEVPPTEVPSSEAPGSQVPSSEAPGSQVPSSEAPGSQVPSSEDSAGEPSFELSVAGQTAGTATQPDTDAHFPATPPSGPDRSILLIVGILGLIVGAIVLLTPARSTRRI